MILTSVPACQGPDTPTPVEPVPDAREVRVILFDAAEGFRVRVDGPCEVRDLQGRVLHSFSKLRWTEIRFENGLRLGDQSLLADPVELVAQRYGAISVSLRRKGRYQPERRFAGWLRLILRDNGAVRVVNYVDTESYIAGVVHGEVWPGFSDEALAVQAVAARTYVLYVMSRRADWSYDVRATEGDQVYDGLELDRLADRARQATARTRGLVLGWDSPEGMRVFQAYYSAACGGMSQSAVHIRPSAVPDPLSGNVRCDFCAIAKGKSYRWGPAKVSKRKLYDRLVARKPELKALRGLAAVRVSEKTAGNRVAQVTLVGTSGRRATLLGEAFRLAAGGHVMRSTDCRIVDAGTNVRFENGKGFGHGVGLCQWGMEGQARLGKGAGEILRYYYPGSKLVRAY